MDIELFRSLILLLVTEQHPGKKHMAMTPRKVLPDEVINRPKTGFSVPVREWLHSEKNAENLPGLKGWAKIVMSNY